MDKVRKKSSVNGKRHEAKDQVSPRNPKIRPTPCLGTSTSPPHSELLPRDEHHLPRPHHLLQNHRAIICSNITAIFNITTVALITEHTM